MSKSGGRASEPIVIKMEDDIADEVSTDVKTEPDVLGDDENVNDSVEDSIISGEAQASMITQDTLKGATSYRKLFWRLCDTSENFSLLQKIETKEAAEKLGVKSLEYLKLKLIAAQSDIPDAQKRITAIDDIIASKGECSITVGFLGVTGAGKSSLINSILGLPGLLPSDDRKACTAVCVQIGWNEKDDPEKAFRARVYCITAVEWRAEIEALIKDIKDESQDKVGQDGEQDFERVDRIKAAFQKLICVYPYIKTHKDLLNRKVWELINDKNVKDVWKLPNNRLSESNSDLKSFAAQIRPYIDSNNAKSDQGITFALWPLVKYVELFVKSPILKDGICLVDLPGSHDTNIARGGVAARYQKDLNICCVIASAERAASDKPAQDLLGEVRQRDMQLDGQFTSNRMCFIITKTDDSITPSTYIEKNFKVRRLLTKDLKKETKAISSRKEAEKYRTERLSRQEVIKTLITQNKAKNRALAKEYNSLKPAHETFLAKRKLGDEVSTSLKSNVNSTDAQQARAEILRGELKSLIADFSKLDAEKRTVDEDVTRANNKVDELKTYLVHSKSTKLAACIKHRNDESSNDIRKYYLAESRAIGRKIKGEDKLQVFPVSSKAYMEICGGDIIPGFRTLADTGIEQLRKWLVEATLGPRKVNSDAMLESILSFELSITPWLTDRKFTYKMLLHEREQIEAHFKQEFKDFQKSLVALSHSTTKSCKLVVLDLTNKFSTLETQASEKAPGIVKGWPKKPKPMHWSTFRVINKNGGYWRRRYARKDAEDLHPYNWNEDLASLYLNKKLIGWWNTTIHEKLPISRANYLSDVKKLTAEFVNGIASKAFRVCPDITSEVDNWKESSLRTFVIVDKKSSDIFNNIIKKRAAETHPLIGQNIRAQWLIVYDECGDAEGKNHYRHSQQLHLDHIEKVKRTMYAAGSTDIRENFKKLWKDLPQEFKAGVTAATTQIMEEFKLLMENHTLYDDKEIADYKLNKAKRDIRQTTLQIFKELRMGWSVEPKWEVEEENPAPEIPVPTLDGLYEAKKDEVENDDDLILMLSD